MSALNIQDSRCEALPFMPKDVKELFINILNVQSSSNNEKRMVVFILEYLRRLNKEKNMGLVWEIDKPGNILVTKGKAKTFPCLVSHMDTVHEILSEYKVVTKIIQGREKAWAMSGEKEAGIGGDDKCGILSCLWMLSHVENIKLVFFTQEESGMDGSNNIDQKWLDDCGYIIQLDRWGRKDFICINGGQKTVSPEFLEIASPLMDMFGYKEAEGLITDSINLWNDEVGVSCINVSCGYYQHHTDKENVDLNETWNALLFTKELILALGEMCYPSLPVYGRYKGYSSFSETSPWKDWKNDKPAYRWNEYDEPIEIQDDADEYNLQIMDEIVRDYYLERESLTGWDIFDTFNEYREYYGHRPVTRSRYYEILDAYELSTETGDTF